MADWQAELESLLSQLHVSLDGAADSATRTVPTAGSDGTAPATVPATMDEADADIPWTLGPLTAEELPADGEEVSAVRDEIAATVRQVVHLARTGRMESALRDDVAFVLQALTRPRPVVSTRRANRARETEAQQEWQLATAAAVLRFCRLVLRLTNALSSEAEC
jgi:hypothetical protein